MQCYLERSRRNFQSDVVVPLMVANLLSYTISKRYQNDRVKKPCYIRKDAAVRVHPIILSM